MDIINFLGREIKLKFYPYMSPYDLNDAYYQLNLYDGSAGNIKFLYASDAFNERILSKFEVSLIINSLKKVRLPTALNSDNLFITEPSFYRKLEISYDRCNLSFEWCNDDPLNYKSTYGPIHSLSNLISRLEPINPEKIIRNWGRYMFE